MSRGPLQRLQDIEDQIALTLQDDNIRAQCYGLIVIGEACKHLPGSWCALEPEIPWQRICGMRDFLAHQYHRVDPQIVEATVRLQLPPLATAIHRLQRKVEEGDLA